MHTFEELQIFIKSDTNIRVKLNTIKNNEKLYNLLYDNINDNLKDYSLIEILYVLSHDLDDKPKCRWCGGNTRFASYNSGYKQFCSKECSSSYMWSTKSKEDRIKIQENKKKTFLARYGVDHNFKIPEVIENRKNTWISNYGEDNPSKSDKVKEKIIQTNISRYNAHSYTSTAEGKNKVKETVLLKYGVEYISQLEEVKEKIRNTNLERYGYEYAQQSEEVKEKIRNTNIKKYGNACSLHDGGKIEKKTKTTNLERYGYEYAQQSKDVKEKMKNTCLKRYGVEHPCQAYPYKFSDYIFDSGRIEKVQGYEGFAITALLESGIKENNIIVADKEIEKEVGKFLYTDFNSITHRYYPDFLIKNNNDIVVCEVKSTYTYKVSTKDGVLELKKNSVLDKGYKFRLIVIDNKKIILDEQS